MQQATGYPPSSESTKYPGHASRPVNKISIIVADDNPDDHVLIQDAFKIIDQNVEYTAVYNGVQLVDLLSNQGVYSSSGKYTPNALILDLTMPVMDGLAALKIIRKLSAHKHIAIFILHTVRHDDYLNQCSSIGVQGIFTKPSSFNALVLILENIYYSSGGVRKIRS